MSLLNDALKRAKEAQRPDTRSSVSSLRSIETQTADGPVISRTLVAVVFLLLAAALAFIGLAMAGRLAKQGIVAPEIALAHPVRAAAPPVTAPEVEVAVPSTPVQPAPAPAADVVAASVQPAPTVAPKPAAAPKPVAVPTPPPTPLVLPESLHVQGVAYDPVRPWAIVSGRTVYVGDLVRGVRVVEITADSVTFSSHGQTNMLFVGQ